MTRAFIIGGGNSLARTPLDLLVDEVTFGMNMVHLIYSQTRWRPTYYCFFEAIGEGRPGHPYSEQWIRYVIKEHLKKGERCFIRQLYQEMIENHRKKYVRYANAQYVDTSLCQHVGANIQSDHRPTEWHLPTLCHYAGTLHIATQIAFMMGYDPIYLVACDLGIIPVTDEMTDDPNHFHPDYWTWDDHDPIYRDATLRDMHAIARREIESKGRHIYNATIGGALEVYERVDFESLF